MRRIVINPSITNRKEDGLDSYLDEVSREKMITPDEEADLARRIKLGDEEALDKLVKANLRFVVSVAKTYQNQGLPLADLISEGNLGLVSAARKFDETRGFKFISYAVWWIRQSIMQALTEQSRAVRLPNNQNQLLRMIRRFQNEFLQREGYNPSSQEIAEAMDVPEDRINDVLRANSRSMSLDAPLTDDDGGTLLDVTPDTDSSIAADAQLDNESLSEELQEVFRDTLKERDIYVLIHSFGIGCRERSHEEIGTELGLTRERVRQIRERALQKLRTCKERERLQAFCG